MNGEGEGMHICYFMETVATGFATAYQSIQLCAASTTASK
jgi:hypothetical protein